MSDSAFLSRSYLFVPGSKSHLIEKAFASGADAVVLDLEDGVAPNDKQMARETVSSALAVHRPSDAPSIYVRINAMSTSLWEADVSAAVAPGVRGIRLAKAESVSEIEKLDAQISVAETRQGLQKAGVTIVPTIESAAGLLATQEMARHPRIEAFCFGAADFARDISADPHGTAGELLYAQSHLVVVSRGAGLNPPVAPVYTWVRDLDGLRRTSLAARGLGFFGRSCIHPTQVPIVDEVFTPSFDEVVEAEAIVSAFQQAGSGPAIMDDGRFVDRAVVGRAMRIIALAKRSSQVDKMVKR